MTSKTTPALLPFPTTLIVVKGSIFVHGLHSMSVIKGEHWNVKEVRELGSDHSHFASIVIERGGKTLTFEVRHVNRLSDPEFNARRWEKPVRFARGPQDASVRFSVVTDLHRLLVGEGRGGWAHAPPWRVEYPQVWKRETVAAAGLEREENRP